ncbi:MAG TPA: response regulator [Polyangiaceae bacterium]|nr:response regulator [Polyangiaceae bacterium]
MPEVRPKIVFVVDDDASLRSLLAKALEAKGYQVAQAGDGMAAAELLGRMARPPDLLICDVMMPTIDGFSLARLIKRRAELREMPLIFLTARTHPVDVVRGVNLGARHYVQKPFSLKCLIEKVEKALRSV